VSTAEQAQRGYSVRQQAERLQTWAEEEGYEMVEVVEECGVSGTVVLLERPGFSRLFDLVIGGEASVVVAQDADRISREPWHFGYLKAKLEEYGATLRTLDDAEADDSPESEFFRDIRRGMAKMERSVTARRTRRGREQRAREGKVVGAGSPPLGFCFNAERTNFVVDEETMPLVRRVFRLVAEEG
jgi:site-specific DNA recombinase